MNLRLPPQLVRPPCLVAGRAPGARQLVALARNLDTGVQASEDVLLRLGAPLMLLLSV